MKKVLYTQRVEIIESYQERRDCADQNIPRFLEACGYLPVPVPNVLSALDELLDELQPSGIVLTGGNSLVSCGGQAPERDDTDRRLIKAAIKKDIPLYGFCRGMQSILDFFGCELLDVEGHTAVRHRVTGIWGDLEVNSYHNQACRSVKEPLEAAEMAEDLVVEAVCCPQLRIIATMWHPEREHPFQDADIRRVQELFL